MKKITEESIIEFVESERIHYLIYDNSLQCKSVIFKAEIELLNDKKIPSVHGILYAYWLKDMLKDKVVTKSDPITVDLSENLKKMTNNSDPFLVVEKTDIDYIAKTFFLISKNVLDEGFKIKSLSYIL